MSDKHESEVVEQSVQFSGIDPWLAIFSNPTPEMAVEYLNADAIEKCAYVDEVDDDIAVITGPSSRVVLAEDEVVSGFPFLKGEQFENCQVRAVTESPDSDGLEAVVTVVHESGFELNFFATDYAFNDDHYEEDSEIKVNLIALAYGVRPAQSIEEDTALVPMENLASYVANGTVSDLTEHKLGEIKGWLVKLQVSPDLNLPFFVRHENVSIQLAVGKQVEVALWLSGTTEDNNN